MVRSKTMEHRKKDECQKLAKEIQNENQNKVITKKPNQQGWTYNIFQFLRTHETQRSQVDLWQGNYELLLFSVNFKILGFL